jgi:hypothetical protein
LTVVDGEEAAETGRNAAAGAERWAEARPRGSVRLSVERDGKTPIDQARWVDAALEMFGRVFGGATAYPKAKGVWRDDERGGVLVKDEPVVVHCYTTPADIQDDRSLADLGGFCRKMGREARQGEIGLVVGNEYFAIRDFAEE